MLTTLKSLSDEVKIIALFKVGTKITENRSLAHYVEFDKTQCNNITYKTLIRKKGTGTAFHRSFFFYSC